MQYLCMIIKLLRPALLALFLLNVGCASSVHHPRPTPSADVLTGIDVLQRDHFALLAGRHIALITNHTGRDRDGNSTVDILAHAPNVHLVCLLSPEHGLFGNVDEKVGNTTEPKTGLPVYSLYGKTTRPNDEMLKGVDTLVYDIQDVGARFYTYSATLGICMQEAAKRHLKFILLDRPNPITGLVVQGPIADKSHFGFTAFGALPVTHGMTFGELACLYNDAPGDNWSIHADLTVIRMENWRRSMWYDDTGLTWINPSPNIRNLNAAKLYPAVCFLESTNVSVGRGTDQPFEQFGAPWIDARRLSAELNAAHLPGVRFLPIEFTPTESRFKGQKCQAVHILLIDRNAADPVLTGLTIVWTIHKLFGDQFEFAKVERILQNRQALEALRTAADPSHIPDLWQNDLNHFISLRRHYLLYP